MARLVSHSVRAATAALLSGSDGAGDGKGDPTVFFEVFLYGCPYEPLVQGCHTKYLFETTT